MADRALQSNFENQVAPANVNRAPRPRLVVDNSIGATAPTLNNPILYRGYILRNKTPQEWEEFGRLNPDIDPQFWDSPIVSKAADRKDRRAIKKRARVEQKRNQQRYPYDVTPTDSRVFAEKRALDSLQKRKASAAKRAGEKVLTATRSLNRVNRRGSKGFMGPLMPGKLSGTGTVTSSILSGFASIIVLGWFPFQLLLAAGAGVFLGIGGLAAGSNSKVFVWLEQVGADSVANGMAGIFGGLITVSLLLYLFMVVISIIQLFIIRNLMRLSTLVSFSEQSTERQSQIWFYLAVFGCIVPAFILALPWINSQRRNPG